MLIDVMGNRNVKEGRRSGSSWYVTVSTVAIGNGLSLSTVFLLGCRTSQGDLGVLEISRNLRFFGTKYPRAVISQRSH